MRVYHSVCRVKRTLLSSLAGFSVIFTAVKSLRGLHNFNGMGSCKPKAFMSVLSEQKMQLGLLMTDFDQTCNMRDTSELYYCATHKYQTASDDHKQKLDEEWSHVTGKYLREYREKIAESLAKFGDNISPDFDEEKLHSFLSEIAIFNKEATKDVDESKLIAGVDKIGLQVAAKRVKFYPGCLEVLKSALPYVRIVSVNWSAEMIGYSFNEEIPAGQIYANKLLDDNGLSSGLIGKQYISSFDKLNLVRQLIESEGCHGKATIFVGDSITDLLSMLEVDIGIIIGNSSTLLSVAKLCGIRVSPLSNIIQQAKAPLRCQNDRTKTLYSAEDWYQIKMLLRRFSM